MSALEGFLVGFILALSCVFIAMWGWFSWGSKKKKSGGCCNSSCKCKG